MIKILFYSTYLLTLTILLVSCNKSRITSGESNNLPGLINGLMVTSPYERISPEGITIIGTVKAGCSEGETKINVTEYRDDKFIEILESSSFTTN